MITVFVGDVGEYLSTKVKEYDPGAKLFVNKKSFETAQTFYTSLGDCSLEDLFWILEKSSVIHYCAPNQWSDSQQNNNNVYSMQFWTEKYLDYFKSCTEKTVIGFNKTTEKYKTTDHDFLTLTDDRKTDLKQLWIIGCSISHGIGVADNERYGHLLSQTLQLPVSWLTKGGSSIQWARDQILRSDIRKDDILCWGITNTVRFSYYKDKILHIHPGFYQDNKWFNNIIPIDQLDSEDQLYQCVTAINQVSNFCEKIGAQLFMIDVFSHEQNLIREYCSNLKNFSTVLDNKDLSIDLGTDKKHPGPLQHKIYAKKFLNMIEKNEC